jgi:hypothetical protein
MMKELSRMHLYQPRPEVPFRNLSFIALCVRVRDMNFTSWYAQGSHNAHPCNLKAAMATLITDASSTARGLNLGDLKNRKD